MAITNTVSSVRTLIRSLVRDQQRTDGRDSFSYIGDTKFTLSENFVDSDSIVVLKNGVDITSSGWTYDSDTNRVTVSTALVTDDSVIILYSYYKKYSDTELDSYLKSSLGYFVQHKYNKTFDIDSNNNIISVNNLKPNTNELYFIAIISSIVIDPQNIEITTPEFKLSANREASDQEQISKAFAQFKRVVGRVDFEKFDYNKNWRNI